MDCKEASVCIAPCVRLGRKEYRGAQKTTRTEDLAIKSRSILGDCVLKCTVLTMLCVHGCTVGFSQNRMHVDFLSSTCAARGQKRRQAGNRGSFQRSHKTDLQQRLFALVVPEALVAPHGAYVHKANTLARL